MDLVPSAVGGDSPDWTAVETCTLPTVERPLRMAEFDDLFATTLNGVERSDAGTSARLLLVGDAGLPERVRRLAAAESACCSFFTFTVTPLDHRGDGPARVGLHVDVPPAHAGVLTALVDRAETVRAAVSA